MPDPFRQTPSRATRSLHELVHVSVVLCIAKICQVAKDVTIPKGRAGSNRVTHPIRRVGPQDLPVPHGFGEIVQIPMQREAWNHRIE